MGLIIPKIVNISKFDSGTLQSVENTIFDSSFNRELFTGRLRSSCPNMAIYDTVENATQSNIEIYHFPPQMSSVLVPHFWIR